MGIEIIYEDDNYLVINKPAGLVVHSDGRTEESTVVDWLSLKYPAIKTVGEPIVLSNGEIITKPGIVHRLDRDTSGVLVVAKTASAFLDLKRQFKYHAFVYGEVKNDQGVINRPIARSRRNFKQWSASSGARGLRREAITEYQVLARHNGLSLLAVYPQTGRTHQIRVHLKDIHHPIVADKLYAPKRDSQLGFHRSALHARRITFTDLSGHKITSSAPYPEDFAHAVRVFNVST